MSCAVLCYRPFLDGPWRLAMGLKALDLDDWIEIDEHFAGQLAERRRMLDRRRARCWGRCRRVPRAKPSPGAAARPPAERFPEHYRRRNGELAN